MENFRNKQLSLKLWAILGSMIKSNSALLTPAWDENHPFVQCVSILYILACSSLSSCLSYQNGYQRERKRLHSYNFHYGILLYLFYFTIIFVNLLLIYKLNFMIGMHIQEKTVHIGPGTIHGFRHPHVALECTPHGYGGLLYFVVLILPLYELS